MNVLDALEIAGISSWSAEATNTEVGDGKKGKEEGAVAAVLKKLFSVFRRLFGDEALLTMIALTGGAPAATQQQQQQPNSRDEGGVSLRPYWERIASACVGSSNSSSSGGGGSVGLGFSPCGSSSPPSSPPFTSEQWAERAAQGKRGGAALLLAAAVKLCCALHFFLDETDEIARRVQNSAPPTHTSVHSGKGKPFLSTPTAPVATTHFNFGKNELREAAAVAQAALVCSLEDIVAAGGSLPFPALSVMCHLPIVASGAAKGELFIPFTGANKAGMGEFYGCELKPLLPAFPPTAVSVSDDGEMCVALSFFDDDASGVYDLLHGSCNQQQRLLRLTETPGSSPKALFNVLTKLTSSKPAAAGPIGVHTRKHQQRGPPPSTTPKTPAVATEQTFHSAEEVLIRSLLRETAKNDSFMEFATAKYWLLLARRFVNEAVKAEGGEGRVRCLLAAQQMGLYSLALLNAFPLLCGGGGGDNNNKDGGGGGNSSGSGVVVVEQQQQRQQEELFNALSVEACALVCHCCTQFCTDADVAPLLPSVMGPFKRREVVLTAAFALTLVQPLSESIPILYGMFATESQRLLKRNTSATKNSSEETLSSIFSNYVLKHPTIPSKLHGAVWALLKQFSASSSQHLQRIAPPPSSSAGASYTSGGKGGTNIINGGGSGGGLKILLRKRNPPNSAELKIEAKEQELGAAAAVGGGVKIEPEDDDDKTAAAASPGLKRLRSEPTATTVGDDVVFERAMLSLWLKVQSAASETLPTTKAIGEIGGGSLKEQISLMVDRIMAQ